MSRALPQLQRRWWSISLPGYRDHPEVYGTYSAFDYDALPPVEQDLDEDLAWLNREPVVPRSLGERAEGDPEPARMATAEQLGLLMESAEVALPTSFSTFIRTTEPRRRVRSATACYLDLARAESFSEFIYRFRIENELWFALTDPKPGAQPLSAEQTRYLRHY